jgi:hypothetical protein
MSSYQGLSTNNVKAKNSLFKSKGELKRIFVSQLLQNHQNINKIEKMLSASYANFLPILIILFKGSRKC